MWKIEGSSMGMQVLIVAVNRVNHLTGFEVSIMLTVGKAITSIESVGRKQEATHHSKSLHGKHSKSRTGWFVCTDVGVL